jgi:hypothetical protein
MRAEMGNWANRLGFLKPRNKVEWTMWIGTGFMLFAIICSLLFVKKTHEFELPPKDLSALYITHILQNLGFCFIATAAFLGGLNHLQFDAKKTKGYVATIGGVLIFLLMIGRPAITSMMFSKIQTDSENFSKHLIEKKSQTLVDRNLSSGDKAAFGKAIAQQKYLQDGSPAEYADDKGNIVKYQPTMEDMKKRESYLVMPRLIKFLRIELILWLIVFVSVVTGSFIYYRKKPQDL